MFKYDDLCEFHNNIIISYILNRLQPSSHKPGLHFTHDTYEILLSICMYCFLRVPFFSSISPAPTRSVDFNLVILLQAWKFTYASTCAHTVISKWARVIGNLSFLVHRLITSIAQSIFILNVASLQFCYVSLDLHMKYCKVYVL